MSVMSKIKDMLSWLIKETNHIDIHPVIPQITIPHLLEGKVAMVVGGHGGIGKAIYG